MALLKCENCGEMISDTAKTCPKCGKNNIKSKQSSKKKVTQVIALIFFLVFSLIGFFCWQTYQEYVIAQKEAEEREMQERLFSVKCDSIYNSFTSTDLMFANLKGFVKSVEITEQIIDRRWDDESVNTEYRFLFNFDKDGNIIEVKSKYLADNEFHYSKFTRNSLGQINTISTRDNYATAVGDSYKVVDVYNFQYDESGNVRTIKYELTGDAWRGGMRKESLYSIGSQNYHLSAIDGIFDPEVTASYQIDKQKTDHLGNWTERYASGTMKYHDLFSDYYDPNDIKETECTVKDIRTIIYYNRSEINFEKYVQK